MLGSLFSKAGKIFGKTEEEKEAVAEDGQEAAAKETAERPGDITYMKAYRIHEEDGSFTFEDQPPRRNCVYDVVNLKLPQGAVILDFGGAPDILKRIRLEHNEYTHLETIDSEPVLVAEAVKNGIGIPTTRYTKLEYIPLQEDIRCDFEELCKKNAPDNIYHVTYSEGRYRLTDMYGSKIITKQEAMRYQAEWT